MNSQAYNPLRPAQPLRQPAMSPQTRPIHSQLILPFAPKKIAPRAANTTATANKANIATKS